MPWSAEQSDKGLVEFSKKLLYEWQMDIYPFATHTAVFLNIQQVVKGGAVLVDLMMARLGVQFYQFCLVRLFWTEMHFRMEAFGSASCINNI